MANDMMQIYEQVCNYARQTALIASIESVLGWDEHVNLPVSAGEYRAEQITYMVGLTHQRWIDRQFGDWLDALAAGPLAADQYADTAINIRRLKRHARQKGQAAPIAGRGTNPNRGSRSTGLAGCPAAKRFCHVPAVFGENDLLEKAAGRGLGL